MGNASMQRPWPTKKPPPVKPTPTHASELEQIRLSAAVHWRRHYSIRPPSKLAVRTIRALMETARANEWEETVAELEGHLLAIERSGP